jgi:hypothetical protein
MVKLARAERSADVPSSPGHGRRPLPRFRASWGYDQVRSGPDQDKARSCGAAQSSSGPSGMILVGLMCGCVV